MAYADNKKWRLSHPEARYKGKKRYYSRSQGRANSRKEYTDVEDRAILAHEVSDSELAARLDRSVQAIQHRRRRLA